jgi:hypothetical protein
MSCRDNNNDIDDEIFDMLFTDAETNNQRIAVRYIRDDIKALLHKPFLFFFAKKIPVDLLDISSKGAAIECHKKLRLKRNIILKLIFKDNHEFTLYATIIYQIKNKQQYGLKFDCFNNELGEYLLSTQNELLFK